MIISSELIARELLEYEMTTQRNGTTVSLNSVQVSLTITALTALG